MSKFSVAIVGGGIGGVTLAVALSKYPDIHFDIYEAASAFGEIGAGVGISGRSVSALTDMGVIDHLKRISTPYTDWDGTWIFRKADVSPEGYQFAQSSRPRLKGTGTYRRSDFLSLMVSLLPEKVQKQHVHFRKRLSHYDQDANGVTLYFTDGTTAMGDLLIGADGIKSPIRFTLYKELAAVAKDEEKSELLKYASPQWSGMVAYRGIVSPEDAEKELGHPHRCRKDRISYVGKQAHLTAYPVAMGISVTAYVFVEPKKDEKSYPLWPADAAWVEQVSPSEMLKIYDGFEDQVTALLRCIKTPSRWAIHELDPLPFYTHERVALLGDAAHATMPHQGQGANQSIEDAYILAVILGSPHTTKTNIVRALKAYEQARLGRANGVIRLSSKSARLYKSGSSDDITTMKAHVEGTSNLWIHLGSPKEAAEEAISWMMEGDESNEA